MEDFLFFIFFAFHSIFDLCVTIKFYFLISSSFLTSEKKTRLCRARSAYSGYVTKCCKILGRRITPPRPIAYSMQILFENFPGNLSFAGGPFARKPYPFIHCQLPGAIFRAAGVEFASLLNPIHRAILDNKVIQF